MIEIEIKVIGEVKENSVLFITESIVDSFDQKVEKIKNLSENLPKGAIIIVTDEEPLLFDEKEMNNRGWFKKETSEEFGKRLENLNPKDHEITLTGDSK